MNDARRTRQTDPPAAPRVERSAAALVAEYIHELSERHANGDESFSQKLIPRAASDT